MSAPALSPRPRIIDTDVHNAFADIRAELRPYLSRHWQVYAERHGIVVPSTDYASPVGVQREYARTPSGGLAGSDPAFLFTDHLDRYGSDAAILNGSHVLGLSVHPDPDWGHAIATAYNQNLANRWLSPPTVSAAPSS